MPSLNTGNAILSNPIKVDSSYNVGIGGAASGSFKLQVTGTTNLTGALSGTSGAFSSSLGVNSTIRSTGQTDPASGVGMELFYRSADTSSYIQSYDRTNGAWKDVKIYGNTLYFGSQGTNNLTIASTGAATFSSSLTVANGVMVVDASSSARSAINIKNTGNGVDIGIENASGNYFGAPAYSLNFQTGNYPMLFWTNNTERMRITSGGFILAGQTSVIGSSYKMQVTGAGGYLATGTASGDASFLSINQAGGFHFYGLTTTGVFYVSNNGDVRNANNSYGAISDISLKENIVDATPKLADLLKVKVRNYNLIADENKEKQIGVIAQELEEIFPNMISNDKQMGTDETIKTVKYSVFVPMLIKAIQEQNQLITDLEARIKQLENK